MEGLQTISEAEKSLSMSRSTILRKINNNEWKEGKHYVDARSPHNPRRAIRINIEAVMDLYSIPSHKRR